MNLEVSYLVNRPDWCVTTLYSDSQRSGGETVKLTSFYLAGNPVAATLRTNRAAVALVAHLAVTEHWRILASTANGCSSSGNEKRARQNTFGLPRPMGRLNALRSF